MRAAPSPAPSYDAWTEVVTWVRERPGMAFITIVIIVVILGFALKVIADEFRRY